MISTKEQQSLLIAVSKMLTRKINVFAIGGTAMMFWGFKDSTLDIDLVFNNTKDRKEFIDAARSLDYNFTSPFKVYRTKDNQPIMLERGTERFDLFLENVISFIFSDDMKKRAEKRYEFGNNLSVKIADPHDIIIMKCATDRVKDRDDIKNIIDMLGDDIDWNIIIKETEKQIKLGNLKPIYFLPETLLEARKGGVDISEDVLKKIWIPIENALEKGKENLKKGRISRMAEKIKKR